MRGKDYQILKRAEIQARLKLPPDQHLAHPESGMVRALYDCPNLPLGPDGMRCRLVVATHPAGAVKSRIGVTQSGVVYELFLTKLSQSAFTASDVVALYLHRGAFETALADEDQEQTQTAGSATQHWVRRHGKSFLNGSGTCVWNWAISFNLTQCARPNLLLPSRLRTNRRLPHRDMDRQPWLCLGK